MEAKKEIMRVSKYIRFLSLVIMFQACQETYIPNVSSDGPDYVVEGFIEAGQGSMQAYVLISESIPFLSEVSAEALTDLYVKDAEVDISDGDQTIRLTELCLSDLPDDIKEELGAQLGLDTDNLDFDYCLYLDLFDQLNRDFGRTYDLRIRVGNDELTAQTTIPDLVPVDSIWFTEVPGNPIDSLAQLWLNVNDPPGPNFYRYFTDDGTGRITTSPFGSITDDVFFDGQDFDFPLTKAAVRGAPSDPATFGFFAVGDTTTIKFCTIDAQHYDFWYTYEFNLNNQGPFASYTRVSHNVEGALGVFGGLAVDVRKIIVEK